MLTISLLIVLVTVAAVFWLDRQESAPIKKLLEWFPAILFAYVIPASITHLFDLDLASVQLHQWSKDFIIPLAILFVMSALSFRQLKIIGLRPILLFVMGSFVIAVLAPLLVLFSGLFSDQWTQLVITEQYWKGLVPIVGGWIGGSTSQLVLKEVVECPEGLFLAILVLDNVLVNIWTILMFQMIKRSDQFNTFFGIEDQIQDFVPDEVDLQPRSRYSILVTAATCVLVMLATTFLVKAFLWKVVLLSVVGLLLGNFIRVWNHALVLKAGGLFIIVIMAILGLKLNFGGFSLPLPVIGLVVVWLLLHYLFMDSSIFYF